MCFFIFCSQGSRETIPDDEDAYDDAPDQEPGSKSDSDVEIIVGEEIPEQKIPSGQEIPHEPSDRDIPQEPSGQDIAQEHSVVHPLPSPDSQPLDLGNDSFVPAPSSAPSPEASKQPEAGPAEPAAVPGPGLEQIKRERIHVCQASLGIHAFSYSFSNICCLYALKAPEILKKRGYLHC